jgi:hypothetical protein
VPLTASICPCDQGLNDNSSLNGSNECLLDFVTVQTKDQDFDGPGRVINRFNERIDASTRLKNQVGFVVLKAFASLRFHGQSLRLKAARTGDSPASGLPPRRSSLCRGATSTLRYTNMFRMRRLAVAVLRAWRLRVPGGSRFGSRGQGESPIRTEVITSFGRIPSAANPAVSSMGEGAKGISLRALHSSLVKTDQWVLAEVQGHGRGWYQIQR